MFDNIKQALMNSDIMAFPTDDGQFILDTDASDETVGAAMTQVQSLFKKIIAYDSLTLGKSKKNYCVTDYELFTVK